MNHQPDTDFPRVLVINHDPFNWQRNNGIVMSNLFSGWPADRLAQVDISVNPPAFDVCSRYWRLSHRAVISSLLGHPPDSSLSPPLAAPPLELQAPSRKVYASWLTRRLRVPLGELLFRSAAVLSSPLQAWISAFRPDVASPCWARGRC